MTTQMILAQEEAGFLKKAAQVFMEVSAAAIERNGIFTVALSGGNTPKKLYSLLSDAYYRSRINWTKTHIFWGDERMVPPNHPDSNYKMAHGQLLSLVPIPSVNVHRIPAEMGSALEVARVYEQSLKLFFRQLAARTPDLKNVTETTTGEIFPRFDLMLLGVGEDGHTASLFPGSTVLGEKTRWVVGGFMEKVSSERVTLTFPVINNARHVLILCGGENKAAVVKEIFQADSSGKRFPAQMVQPLTGELIWLLDKGAASQLPAALRYKALHV